MSMSPRSCPVRSHVEPSLEAAARTLSVLRSSLVRRSKRFRLDGRDGLVDTPRPGRPHKINHEACASPETALAASPMDDAYPVMTRTVVDPADLLTRQGWEVDTATVYRPERS